MTIHATTEAPPVEDPYVGLTYFTENYLDFFFGRDNESALIIGNLRASRLTLLYAESGVGKSSVLRAGVVARLHESAAERLRAGGGARLVPVVFSSWSERPIAGLVHAIGEAVRPYVKGEDLPELPEDDLEAALEAAGEALDATLLVILDQFEEYFLYPEEAPERERVAAQIARCVNRRDLRASFLISIREDSYAQLGDLFRGKVNNVYGNFLHLDFLDRAGAREAIEGPIERFNELRPEAEPFTVEPALVDAVLDQVRRDDGDDRVETTYLQLVMRRLWEEETAAGSHTLRLRTLEKLGGAQAIIGSHLDRAMEGGADGAGLTPEQRRTAARIFRFLVTSGGTKIALTTSDLADLSGLSAAEIEPVLRHLSSPQLHILRPVVFQDEGSEPRFEIFHDALAEPINKWRAQVEDKERERERVEKEEAQRAAARAERRARVAQVLLAVAVVALIAGAVFFAIEQKNVADQREADNQSVRAAERIAELARTPTFGPAAAALASVEDYGLSPTVEARNQALAQLQLNPGLPNIAVGHTREVESVAYFPDGSGFASSGADQTVRLWNVKGRELWSPLHVPSAALGLAVGEPASDGGRILAAGLSGGRVALWRVGDGRRPQVLSGITTHSGELWGIAFNPQLPGMLAVGSTQGGLTLWSLQKPQHPVRLAKRRVAGGINDVAFAADGRSLFVAGENGGEAFGVSGKGFAASSPVKKVSGPETAVATAPNGSYAFGGKRGIKLWDAVRGRRLHIAQPGEVDTLAFARGGSILVSGGTDWNVTTWDVASGRSFGPPRSFEKLAADDVTVSPDGRTILAGGEDHLLKLWPLRPASALATTVGSVSAGETSSLPKLPGLAVGEGGRVVAAAGPTGTSLWSLRDPDPSSPPKPLAQIPGASRVVAYHGDILVTGRRHSFAVYGTGHACRGKGEEPCLLASPSSHSRVRIYGLALASYGKRLLLATSGSHHGVEGVDLWDLSNAENGVVVHLRWRAVQSLIECLALSPTDPLLAIGTVDGKVRVWDVSHPGKPKKVKSENPFGDENQPVDALAFSPDGAWLASGGADQQVALWRVIRSASGPVVVKPTPGTLTQGQSIFSLAFSPDGKTLAVGDSEGNACLYGVASRHAIGGGACLLGHRTELDRDGGIEAAEFARLPDGETVLLTAGAGQGIVAWKSILWNLSDQDRVEREITGAVCRLAGRDLERNERKAIFKSTKLGDGPRPICSK